MAFRILECCFHPTFERESQMLMAKNGETSHKAPARPRPIDNSLRWVLIQSAPGCASFFTL